MMGTRKIPALLMPANNTLEKTVPCTNDFFEPQNRAVIRSSRLNRSFTVIRLIEEYTMKNKVITPKPTMNRTRGLMPLKIPDEKELEKLLYTMIKMIDLSNMVRYRLFLSAKLPQYRCSATPTITGSNILIMSSTNV